MFFVVRSNDSFNFELGWIKYIVIANVIITSDRNWLIRTLLLSEWQSDDITCCRQAHYTAASASAVATGDSGGEEACRQFGWPAVYGSLDDLQCTAVWMTCSVRQFEWPAVYGSVRQFGWPAVYGNLDDLQCTAVWMTCSVRQSGWPAVYGSLRAETRLSIGVMDRKEGKVAEKDETE